MLVRAALVSGQAGVFETAVKVDPELIRADILQHFIKQSLTSCLLEDTGRVDIVDTGTDMAAVGLIYEDLEQLGIRLAILEEFHDGLRFNGELEGLVVLQDRLHIVVGSWSQECKDEKENGETGLTFMG